MFWAATVLLLVIGAAFILLPLSRQEFNAPKAEQVRIQANLALYRERVDELAEELESGDLGREEYEGLVAELQRSLLNDARQEEHEPRRAAETPVEDQSGGESNAKLYGGRPGAMKLFRPVYSIPLVLVLLIPVLAYTLYGRWGHYDDIQLAGLFRQAIHPGDDPRATSALIMDLKSALEDYPDNQWAWYFLGRSYSRLGMHDRARDALQSAISTLDNEADRLMAMSQYVLSAFLAADRQMTPEARSMADRVLAANPNEMTVLRILATEAREREDFRTAIAYWQRLVRASPASSATKVYRSNITAAENILRQRGELASEPTSSEPLSPKIEVAVALAPGLNLAAELSVFIAARDAQREGMPPLAAARLTVGDLPAKIVLDNSSAVGPFNLSMAESVFLSALVSREGIANPKSGDYRVVSEPLIQSKLTDPVRLIITEAVP